MNIIKKKILLFLRIILSKIYPELKYLPKRNVSWNYISSHLTQTKLEDPVKLYEPYHLYNVEIGKYTYIAQNSNISYATIGRFCSIGPNVIMGWGIHPTNGISTHPMFYSTRKQNGLSLSSEDKILEREPIEIGNDVFIGANVTILDGVKIGDGAVIGAGAVVSKDIPPYAIAVGTPIKIIKYRFPPGIIEKIQNIQWWDLDKKGLKDVEKYFFSINMFIEKYSISNHD